MASKIEQAKHKGASDFWSKMFAWVTGRRKGKMPYPVDAKPPKPLHWWEFLKPLYTEQDILELSRFHGEVIEFGRWLPWTTLRK